MESILIIDDEAQIRSMVRLILEREGYAVAEAPDGIEGIRLFRQKPADLVITDLIMPEENGLETILELERRYPSLKIIAMTGSGHFGALEDLNTATILGADRTFSKPFHLEDMLLAVKELLNNSDS